MREYPDNHGGIFDGGDDLQVAATMRTMLESMQGSLSGGVENPEGAYCGCLSAGLIFGMLAAESIVASLALSR